MMNLKRYVLVLDNFGKRGNRVTLNVELRGL
jgi:hypothetical protein